MLVEFFAGMLLGLAGSLHCIGMCGPLILIFPFNTNSKIVGYFQNVLYHFGRIFIYCILGLLFGFVFQIVDLKYFEQYFSLAIGGLFLILWYREFFGKQKVNQGALQRGVLRLFGKAMQSQSLLGMFLAGMLNGLLPCGLVYGALLAAFGTGSTEGSFIFMLGFGLATIPSLMLVYSLKNIITVKLRNHLSKFLPWWLLLLGVWFLLRGLNLGIPYLSPKIHPHSVRESSCCKPMKL
jgi:hypothetical protein